MFGFNIQQLEGKPVDCYEKQFSYPGWLWTYSCYFFNCLAKFLHRPLYLHCFGSWWILHPSFHHSMQPLRSFTNLPLKVMMGLEDEADLPIKDGMVWSSIGWVFQEPTTPNRFQDGTYMTRHDGNSKFGSSLVDLSGAHLQANLIKPSGDFQSTIYIPSLQRSHRVYIYPWKSMVGRWFLFFPSRGWSIFRGVVVRLRDAYLVGGWTTHLKNISQIGSFPQGSGWKFQKYLSCHQPDVYFYMPTPHHQNHHVYSIWAPLIDRWHSLTSGRGSSPAA